jgi:ankyrin repeat protein
VNAVDSKNTTPLLAVAKVMIQQSASLPHLDDSTVFDVISTLVSSGADVNAQDSIEGKTVLHLCACVPVAPLQVIDLVLENGRNLEIR